MSEMHQPILPKDANPLASTHSEPSESPDTVGLNLANGFRRFIAANPFYLTSIVLLLYGIHRVSSDTGFLRIETQQLFFNFTAIQFYELALVGLAVFLARRLVWYDSTLLALLENLVVIVPFILVTQASLIDQRWIWGFCAAGIVLAVARLGLLKHFFRELNLPGRMLAVGGVLLLANAVLPIVYRELQEERMGKTITWGPAYEMNEWSWLVILPVLVACANLLPKPRAAGPLWPHRQWLPFAVFASWLVASGVHLYALSYVYTFEMRPALWAPTLVVLAWTLQRRVMDFVQRPVRSLPIALLLAPFPLAMIALGSGDTGVALALFLMNTGLYGWETTRNTHRRLAVQLALASGVAALACVSATWPVAVGLHSFGFVEALVGYVFLTSVLSRRVELGLVGSVAAGSALGMMIPAAYGGIHCAIHGALMFLLVHSLRWDDQAERSAPPLRWVAGAAWALHALIWTATGGPVWQLAGIGAGVMLIWLLVMWMGAVRPPIAVAIGAAAVALSGAGVQVISWIVTAPAGPLAVAASFVLLAVGTIVALTKHRWHLVSED